MKSHLLARTIGVAALILSAVPAWAAYDSLVVFGDSLSDSGNNALILGTDHSHSVTNTYISIFPYAAGTYSNAAVWTDTFASAHGLALAPSLAGGTNYAFGGAQTATDGAVDPPGVLPPGFPYSANTQLASYLSAGPSPARVANSLYVIAVGANDVRELVSDPTLNAGNAQARILQAAQLYSQAVDGMVQDLQNAGAQNIVVWNVPDLGKTPLVETMGLSNPLIPILATGASAAFNSFLDGAMAGEAGVEIFRIFEIMNLIVANPAAYGLANVDDACGGVTNCDPSKYLFWDGIHPTSAGHALIAAEMLELAPVPEPGTWIMMSLGLAGLLLVRRHS